MRNRTLDSNTPLDPAPVDTSSLDITALDAVPFTPVGRWCITEMGLRASGAASMRATIASLRQAVTQLEEAAARLEQDAPAPSDGSGLSASLDLRRMTVCGRYQHQTRVPDLRLSGKWLRNAGFELGQKVQVQVGEGQLVICAE